MDPTGPDTVTDIEAHWVFHRHDHLGIRHSPEYETKVACKSPLGDTRRQRWVVVARLQTLRNRHRRLLHHLNPHHRRSSLAVTGPAVTSLCPPY